jgi:hypothetical protein
MNGEVSTVSLGLEDMVPSLASNEEMQMHSKLRASISGS